MVNEIRLRKYLIQFLLIPFACLFLTYINSLFAQTQAIPMKRAVVKFSPSLTEIDKGLVRGTFVNTYSKLSLDPDIEIWEFPADSANSQNLNSADYLHIFSRKNGIARIEWDHHFAISDVPNDPFVEKQWYSEFGDPSNRHAHIGLKQAWRSNTSNKSVKIGIIDTGIDYSHEDLSQNIWQNLAEDADGDGHTLEMLNGKWQLDPGDLDGIDADNNGYTDDLIGWDFIENDNNPMDENGHGTHIAGITAAKRNNGKGIAGISNATSLMVLKAFDETGNGNLSSILPAMEYARKMGVQIISNSWGGNVFSDFLYEEIEAAEHANIIFVAAAGNNGDNLDINPLYPAAFDLKNIISVAAFDRNDKQAFFSSFGSRSVDIFAPGEKIFSTLPNIQYGHKSGTSMAVPFVAGAMAVLFAAYPEYNAIQAKELLLNSVALSPSYRDLCVSEGRLDIGNALRAGTNTCIDWFERAKGYEVKSLAESDDYYWAATSSGLVRLNKLDCSYDFFDQQTVSEMPKGKGKGKEQKMLSVAVDHQGGTWVGTEKNGVYYFDGTKWKFYTKKNSKLPDDRVNTIIADPSGEIWIGTEKKGIVRIKTNGDWEVIGKTGSRLPDHKVKDLAIGPDGAVWIGTHKGVTKYMAEQWTVFDKKNTGLHNDKITSISIDNNKNSWIATDKGVAYYNGDAWKVYEKKNSGIGEDKIYAIAVDENNEVWMASKKGLFKFDGSHWQNFKKNNSNIPDDHINDILIDYADKTWVGTKKGFQVLESQVIASFGKEAKICLEQETKFRNSSIGANSYEWYVNDVRRSEAKDFSYTFTESGTYIITLVASNNFSYDEYETVITIDPSIKLELGPDRLECAEAIALNPQIEAASYIWRNKDGLFLSDDAVLTVRESGTYRLIITDGCGNTYKDKVNVALESGCVRPGDVNVDGKINALDFLCLGYAHGYEGPSRLPEVSQNNGILSNEWPYVFPAENEITNAANLKHADCDGNGIIHIEADGQVIRENVQHPHNSQIDLTREGAVLKLINTNIQVLSSGHAKFSYKLTLNNSDSNNERINNFYGLVFGLTANVPFAAAPVVQTQNTWRGGVSTSVFSYPGSNRYDFAIASYDLIEKSVKGKFANLDIIVTVDDLAEDPILQSYATLELKMDNVTLVDAKGNLSPISYQSNSISSASLFDNAHQSWSLNQMTEADQEATTLHQGSIEDLFIYPNPLHQSSRLIIDGRKDQIMFDEIRIRDLQGKLLWAHQFNHSEAFFTIPMRRLNLIEGIYFLEVSNKEKTITKKMNIIP